MFARLNTAILIFRPTFYKMILRPGVCQFRAVAVLWLPVDDVPCDTGAVWTCSLSCLQLTWLDAAADAALSSPADKSPLFHIIGFTCVINTFHHCLHWRSPSPCSCHHDFLSLTFFLPPVVIKISLSQLRLFQRCTLHTLEKKAE